MASKLCRCAVVIYISIFLSCMQTIDFATAEREFFVTQLKSVFSESAFVRQENNVPVTLALQKSSCIHSQYSYLYEADIVSSLCYSYNP